jgi:endonuclease/exonuclease/phosphatase family metal-dependent hydrolase
MSRVAPAALAFALGCASAAPRVPPGGPAGPVRPPEALAVMTFNIRYGTAPDQGDAWPARQNLALEVIHDFDPAVLGLQEALRFQLDAIGAALPHYAEVGVGRDDGQQGGEYAAILYDRRRFDLLDQGRFWLSDTPEVPGSMTWGNRFPRIVTWARLADRRSAATFYVFNTHWDHESAPARERSAALMLQRIAARAAPADPVLLLGDFNTGPADPAFTRLLSAPLVETFRAANPSAPADQIGTYHAFRGGRRGAKIDAVLASPRWRVLEAAIVTTSAFGRYPSDHFPVTTVLLLPR